MIRNHRPLDFRGLRDCSYGTKRFASRDRWVCVGDAAGFLDPLYSPGIDFIGMSNSLAVEMIFRDWAEARLSRARPDSSRRVLRVGEPRCTRPGVAAAFTEVSPFITGERLSRR